MSDQPCTCSGAALPPWRTPAVATLRDIQEQLRHASAATTANVYVQAVPESVRDTVEKMDRALRQKAKAAKENA